MFHIPSCVYRQQKVEPHADAAPVGRVQVTLAEDDVKPAETNGQVRDSDMPGGCRGVESPVSVRICCLPDVWWLKEGHRDAKTRWT